MWKHVRNILSFLFRIFHVFLDLVGRLIHLSYSRIIVPKNYTFLQKHFHSHLTLIHEQLLSIGEPNHHENEPDNGQFVYQLIGLYLSTGMYSRLQFFLYTGIYSMIDSVFISGT